MKGARPQQATPFVIVFTDGFGQKDTTEAASLLRNIIPNVFAVAVSSEVSKIISIFNIPEMFSVWRGAFYKLKKNMKLMISYKISG